MEADQSDTPEDAIGNYTFLDHYMTHIRAVVGTTCALSVAGSLVIVLSYLCFPSLRGRTRLILLHLSLMDCGVGLANLVGIAVNFDKYYKPSTPWKNISSSLTLNSPANLHLTISDSSRWVDVRVEPSEVVQAFCQMQAFFAVFFTLSSVLWTAVLAVHLHSLIVYQRLKQGAYLLWVSYPLCYGMPLLVSFWLQFTHRLGYAPYDSSGWCSIITRDPQMVYNPFVSILGYDMWMFFTIIFILMLYLSTCTYARLEGIGDSGQGIVNAILFVLFTKNVRDNFKRWLCCCCLYCCGPRGQRSWRNEDSVSYGHEIVVPDSESSVVDYKGMAPNIHIARPKPTSPKPTSQDIENVIGDDVVDEASKQSLQCGVPSINPG